MPVVSIIFNKEASQEAKVNLMKQITDLYATECRVPPGHVHCLIQDNAFFSFGGDVGKAAVFVTVRSSALQITPEARRNLVAEQVPLLQGAVADLDAYRINTMFEELPVECIAVGANIATFAKQAPGSRPGSIGGAPAPAQ